MPTRFNFQGWNPMKALIPRLIFSACFFLLAACSSSPETKESLAIETEVFDGILPCENCKGISTQLILKRKIESGKPKGFFLHEVRIDSPGGNRVNSIWGEWSQKGDTKNEEEVVYILHPEVGSPRYYQVEKDNKLRLLDRLGQPANSKDGMPLALHRVVPSTPSN